MSLTVNLGDLRLQSGRVLPDVQLACTSLGALAPQGDNVILVTHGFTSAHTMIEPGHLVAEGSWAGLVGPGRPLDTDRYQVICSNMLGSSFGSTGPRSANPATGKPWGPDFPDITLADIVEAQFQMLQHLGVRHLRAVIGPSFGGFQALQWALDHPDWVDAIGVISSDFSSPAGQGKVQQQARLSASPQWHGGWYYDQGGMRETLEALRRQTLRSYGLERVLAARGLTLDEAQARIEAACGEWAERFDANSLPVLAGAAEHFDVRGRLHEIRARVLMVQASTDAFFPASETARQRLSQLAGPWRYRAIDSPYGHMAASVELAQWQDEVTWLLDAPMAP